MAKTLVVLLDAGHGRNTAGKRTPDGFKEFYFNDPTAEFTADLLDDYENVKVHFVYDEDGSTDTPLTTRTNTANKILANYGGKSKVDCVYISIHANAFGSGWNTADGVETYVHPQTPQVTVNIANAIHKELIKATGRDDRGLKRANFHVLRETVMNALLIEAGFMTNKAEASLLKTEAYQRKVAGAIVKGLENYFGIKKKPAPKPKPSTPSGTMYRVVTGSFDKRENAEQRMKALKAKGFDSFLLPYGTYFRVVTGSFKDRDNANDRVKALKAKGFDSFLLPYKG